MDEAIRHKQFSCLIDSCQTFAPGLFMMAELQGEMAARLELPVPKSGGLGHSITASSDVLSGEVKTSSSLPPFSKSLLSS